MPSNLTAACLILLMSACAHSPNAKIEGPRDLASAKSSRGIDLKRYRVYEVTDLEERLINKILEAGGLGQFEAKVSIVDPVTDPQGAYEAVLRPIAGMLESVGLYNTNLTLYVPRDVKYFTKKGHGLVTSCYLYLQQLKVPTEKVYLNSRQCNLTWPGIAQINDAERLTQFFSGVATIGDELALSDVRMLNVGEKNEQVEDLLRGR